MKVRWTNRSLRLRIAPPELAALERGESATEESGFPGGWRVALEPGENTALLAADAPGALRLSLSPADLADLARPDSEGVYFSEGSLRYYIEKDFPCLHPRSAEARETATETFAAPTDFSLRKLA